MANLYDLKRFDLNLLVIFECIYQHLSISKAAEMLFITPSAVSQSLQRLRAQFNDPLFIRNGKGNSPTTVAINLHQHLSKNLNQLEQTINMMGNTHLDKKFIIYGPQLYFTAKIAGFMNTILTEPNLQIEYHDFACAPDTAENLLQYRKADIVFTTTKVQNRALICLPFLEFPVTLVCRKDHPRLKNHATVQDVLNERFTFYNVPNQGVKQAQYSYEGIFANRKCAFRSSSLTAIINAIHQTDLIGILPTSYFDAFKDSLQLKAITIPKPLPSMTLYLVYNRTSLSAELFERIIRTI
ncbi:LysR family transcriptional regulator [Kluyvera sp. STS39-E]|uniref:DNA-binding transcriptional repressor CitR n=1 Tax=Kluyvera sp. STS39-E TaxID=3234748 RepID=UPI0034C5F27A